MIVNLGVSLNDADSVLNLFVGYDEGEAICFHVLVQSIIENTKMQVRITPIFKKRLFSAYRRKKEDIESTHFALTRFLVPWMSNYSGWSLYCDSDFVFVKNLKEIWDLRDEKFQVMVCKHDYTPALSLKKNNKQQSVYKYKNWSSLMLFNNSRCQALSPDYVSTAQGLDLHQFRWVEDFDQIGEIPREWNHLVGEENQILPAKGIHYTNGIEFRSSKLFLTEWTQYLNLAFSKEPFADKSYYRDEKEYISGINPEWIQTDKFDFGPLGKFLNVAPKFKRLDKKTDYLQVMNEVTQELYLLKFSSVKFRGLDQTIPFIKTHALGSYLAESLGFKTQDCFFTQHQGHDCLLIKDIRGEEGILGMEPLSYESKGFIGNEARGLFLLSSEFSKAVKSDVKDFFTKLIIFDFLIANGQRDARSLRLIKKRDCETPIFDVLIENNFGITYFHPDLQMKFEEIVTYICVHQTFASAFEMIERVEAHKIKILIEEVGFLSPTEKLLCLEIFQQQYHLILELKKNLMAAVTAQHFGRSEDSGPKLTTAGSAEP